MRVVVVGGGVSGLAAAQRLRELGGDGVELVVLERSDRLGGKIHTGSLAGVPVETGAESFLMRELGAESAVLELARTVGLGDRLVHPSPVAAAIAVDHGLHPVPAGTLLGVPADPSTLDSFVHMEQSDVDLGSPLVEPGQDVGVGWLVRQRFGDSIVDRLVDPVLGGVYAGRADQLSLATTMPGLYAAAQREHTLSAAVGSALAAAPRPTGQPVFASVRGGLSTLVTSIADAARARIEFGSTVRRLVRTGSGWTLTIGSTRDAVELSTDAVVLAVPAAPAARLLDSTEVGALQYASIALVTFAFPPGTGLPGLSGFLVPATEGYAVKAATFISTKWTLNHGPVLVRASIGRHGDEELLQRPDADLIAQAHRELGDIIGATMPDPAASAVYRWGGGLPQYGVGHLDRVARVRSTLPGTLALAGAAYDGVGIAACVRSGQAAADAVWRSLENGNHE